MANAWPTVEAEAALVPRQLSAEEWLALDEDEEGEWVDGWLTEEEGPDFAHELTVTWLVHVMRSWLGGRGFVAMPAIKWVIGPSLAPIYVQFFRGGRMFAVWIANVMPSSDERRGTLCGVPQKTPARRRGRASMANKAAAYSPVPIVLER